MNSGRLEYVYLIRHKKSSKFYAGSRSSKKCHPCDFWVTYFTSSKYVKEIIEAEGKDSFDILEIIPRPLNDALEYEVAFLKSVNAAMNVNWLNKSNGNETFNFAGLSHSSEARAKISYAARNMSATSRAKISYAARNMSAATRAKISIAAKGRIPSTETRIKLSVSQKGRIFSDEHRAKLSTAKKGRVLSNETRTKMSATHKGNTRPLVSCPHCAKIGGDGPMKRWHFDNCKSRK